MVYFQAIAKGVSVFTVGVGDEALMTSLALVATYPECDHQIRVDHFVSLSNIAQQTQFKICRGEHYGYLGSTDFQTKL